MLNKLFNKKPAEPSPEPILEHDQIWPTLPTRQRFRRTRSAASESLYADYVSDDWGDAPTVFHDRDGHEIYPRSSSVDDLEDWQRPPGQPSNPGQALFRNMSARVRSLSVSRPNWSRAPPSHSPGGVPTYGWARRVEQAGGEDTRQMRREEERARRGVAIPVPNPAPGPIDVRGDRDDVVEGTSALQAPALVRRKSSSRREPGTRPKPGTEKDKPTRTAQGHRSSTSSPTIIVNPKPPAGTRRHLSRVEKIAAVLQHVASLPFIADTPVKTYYPPTDADKLADQKQAHAPTEPFHTYDVPPSVPKRYRPPPVTLQPCWYQPKPPKPPKKKKEKAKEGIGRKTKTNLGGIADMSGLTLDELDDELFEYPDYDDYADRIYTGDTPTLQSDEISDGGAGVMVNVMDYPIRPAFFPGPIKSTGLTTRTVEAVEPVEEVGVARPGGPLRIMPPPGAMGPGNDPTGMSPGPEMAYGDVPGLGYGPGPAYGPGAGMGYGPGPRMGYGPGPGLGYGPEAEYDYDDYDDEYYEDYEDESSRGPIPSPLTASGVPEAPPLVIPTPTGKTAPVLPWARADQDGQTYARRYEAAIPNPDPGAPVLPGGWGARVASVQEGQGGKSRGDSAQGARGGSAQGLSARGASAQGWGGPPRAGSGSAQRGVTSAQGWGPRGGSAQGWGPRGGSAQGWGTLPGPIRGVSAQGWGPPVREPSVQGWGKPPPGSAQGWGKPPGSAQGWGKPPSSAQGWGKKPSSAQGWAPPKRAPSVQDWAPPRREPSVQDWGPPRREPSAQGWGPPRREPSAQDWGPPRREPSAQDWAPPTREPGAPPGETSGWGKPSSQGWGQSPAQGWGQSSPRGWGLSSSQGSPQDHVGKPPSQSWGSSSESEGYEYEYWGPTPDRTPRAHEFPVPPGMSGPMPKGYEPSRWGPSPQIPLGAPPTTGWGPSPRTAYGPSPQFAYGPSPPQAYVPYPYYPPPFQDPYGLLSSDGGKQFHITHSPSQRHRGDSPPPIPSPIATSIARSRSSHRRDED
ncbi:hypothetical protein FRC12_017376 [Ceratobasidium sp. 428]|nr:hypothetical protein FRC12_017376 [Ceratobasidium sp. 428]